MLREVFVVVTGDMPDVPEELTPSEIGDKFPEGYKKSGAELLEMRGMLSVE